MTATLEELARRKREKRSAVRARVRASLGASCLVCGRPSQCATARTAVRYLSPGRGVMRVGPSDCLTASPAKLAACLAERFPTCRRCHSRIVNVRLAKIRGSR